MERARKPGDSTQTSKRSKTQKSSLHGCHIFRRSTTVAQTFEAPMTLDLGRKSLSHVTIEPSLWAKRYRWWRRPNNAK